MQVRKPLLPDEVPQFLPKRVSGSCCCHDPRDLVVAKDWCGPAIRLATIAPKASRRTTFDAGPIGNTRCALPVAGFRRNTAIWARKGTSPQPTDLPSAPTCRFGQLRFAARFSGRADGGDGAGWRRDLRQLHLPANGSPSSRPPHEVCRARTDVAERAFGERRRQGPNSHLQVSAFRRRHECPERGEGHHQRRMTRAKNTVRAEVTGGQDARGLRG